MKKLVRSVVLFVPLALYSLALLSPSAARAWGAEGHAIIAEVAQRQLTDKAQQIVRKLIGKASLASIASWADDIRTRRPETARWHFVDISLAQKRYSAEGNCKPSSGGDCIVAALQRQWQILADSAAPTATRAEALRFVVHLVGDIHQPLHAVADNQGGNAITVRYFVDALSSRKETTNLHLLWDFGLMRRSYLNWGAYVDHIEASNARLTDAADGVEPVAWALESHAVAHTQGLIVPNGTELGEDYYKLARPLLDQQLSRAAQRLAKLLNQLTD